MPEEKKIQEQVLHLYVNKIPKKSFIILVKLILEY